MEKTGPKIYFFEDNGEKIDFRNFLLKRIWKVQKHSRVPKSSFERIRYKY